MKRLILLAALMLAGPALAQPEATTADDVISLSVGRAEVVPFNESIGSVEFMPKDIADAVPHSDKKISVVGIKTGLTQMFVFSSDRRLIYSAAIAVGSEPGRMVKIYGTTKKDDISNAGFEIVYCDEFGCGRPDKDLPRPAVSVERVVTQRR